MQNIEKGGDSIASGFANFSLLDQRFIKEGSSILFLFLSSVAAGVLSISLLLGCCPRDVKSHLHKLVLASAGLLATPAGTTQSAIVSRIARILGQR